MSFTIGNRTFTGCSGDGYKEAAQKLYNEGETTLNPNNSNVDPLNARYIQAELDKLVYTKGKPW